MSKHSKRLEKIEQSIEYQDKLKYLFLETIEALHILGQNPNDIFSEIIRRANVVRDNHHEQAQ